MNAAFLLGVLLLYALVFNGIAMFPTFQMPTLNQFGVFLLIGIFGGTGQLVMIAATRRAAANQIAPTQYSQIFWAILLGGLLYNEYPDTIAVIGLIIVVPPGSARQAWPPALSSAPACPFRARGHR